MSQHQHFARKERFVSFGFEQSLRKYQPPVRKFFKPEKHGCNHCTNQSKDVIHKQRLARLCETRKKYQITSREQASEYSRKKDKQSDSSRVKRQHSVSDFDCSDPLSSLPLWQNPSTSINTTKNKENEFQKVMIGNGSVTPIKEQIRNSLKMEEEQIFREMKQLQINQKNRTKDIDFHICKVQELHGEFFKQYAGQQSPKKQPMNSINHNVSEFSDSEGKQIGMEIVQQNSNRNEGKENKKNYYRDDRVESQQDGLYQMFIQDFEKFNLNQSEDQEIQQNKKNDEEIKSIKTNEGKQKRSCQRLFREKKLLTLCQISVSNGRIRIQSDKGPCFLSKRNLLKLFSQASLNQVTQKVKNIHPYLNDPSQALQSLLSSDFQKNQKN